MRYNPALFNILMDTLQQKEGFVQLPPIDPAQAAQGGIPMDPSMAAGGGGTPPGADPSMMGGAPPQGADPAMAGMDPSMMGAPPADPAAAGMDNGMPGGDVNVNSAPAPAGSPGDSGDVESKIRKVLEETGVIKAPKLKAEEMLVHIQRSLESIGAALGVRIDPMPVAQKEGTKSDSGGSSSSAQKPATKSAEAEPAISKALRQLRGK